MEKMITFLSLAGSASHWNKRETEVIGIRGVGCEY